MKTITHIDPIPIFSILIAIVAALAFLVILVSKMNLLGGF
jgi:hypothetical protein